MSARPRNLLRTLARLRTDETVASLQARSSRELQRVARSAVQRLTSRWSGWARILNPRQRQIMTVVSRPRGPDIEPAADPASLLRDLHSADWNVRARAAGRLAQVQSESAEEALIATLRDPSAEVALSAVDALAQRRGPRVDPALRDVVCNREGFFSPLTRAAAIKALADGFSQADLAMLFEAVNDVDSEVSLAAIEALAHGAPEAARKHLFAVLRDQSGYFLPPVRRAAANALKRANALSESERGELLESESDPAIRDVLSASWAVAS